MTGLCSFTPRSQETRGLTVGELRKYIELPMSAKMSWPPQNQAVQQDLEAYIKRNKLEESAHVKDIMQSTSYSLRKPKRKVKSSRESSFKRSVSDHAATHSGSFLPKPGRASDFMPKFSQTAESFKSRSATSSKESATRCVSKNRRSSVPPVENFKPEFSQKRHLLISSDGSMKDSLADLKFKTLWKRDAIHRNVGDLRIYHSLTSRSALRPTSRALVTEKGEYVKDFANKKLEALLKTLLKEYSDIIALKACRGKDNPDFKRIVGILNDDADIRFTHSKEARVKKLLDYALTQDDQMGQVESRLVYEAIHFLELGKEPLECLLDQNNDGSFWNFVETTTRPASMRSLKPSKTKYFPTSPRRFRSSVVAVRVTDNNSASFVKTNEIRTLLKDLYRTYNAGEKRKTIQEQSWQEGKFMTD